jgi:hypothetical protein
LSQAIPRTFPFGTQLRLTYDAGTANQIQVTLTEENFTHGDRGTLKLIGYGRNSASGDEPQYKETAMGTTVRTGPIHRPKQQFTGDLVDLTMQQAYGLSGMTARQAEESQIVTANNYTRHLIKPIILDDQLLAMFEPTPRTRPKIGTMTGAPSIPGIEYFWSRFGIVLFLDSDWERWGCAGDRYQMKFTARELYPPLSPATYDA